MYWRFVFSAMRLRARRLTLAFTALTVAAALSTALFSIYSGVERRIGAEFAGYGANLIVASRGKVPAVALSAAAQARALGATAAAPFVYETGSWEGQPVSLVRTDFTASEQLTQFWHMEGARGPFLVGVNLAQRFHLKPGTPTGYGPVAGIVSTGGPEDNEFILPLEPASAFATLIEIHAPADRLEALSTELRKRYPGADVRPVRALATTETNVVSKIRATLFLLLGLILVITGMSVTSNFSELVMERRTEIGILKAIGAVERRIASLFLAESLLLGLASAITGYFAGTVLAGLIGQSVFSAPFRIEIEPAVLLSAGALTLTVALAATAFAAQTIWRIEPARILRGE